MAGVFIVVFIGVIEVSCKQDWKNRVVGAGLFSLDKTGDRVEIDCDRKILQISIFIFSEFFWGDSSVCGESLHEADNPVRFKKGNTSHEITIHPAQSRSSVCSRCRIRYRDRLGLRRLQELLQDIL